MFHMPMRLNRILPWLAAITFPLTLSAQSALPDGVKAPPGFHVTLFAAPPEVNYPVCISAAPTGELFVGIDQNGSLDTKRDRGRIVRCVDQDHDGHADHFTDFTHVDSPRGLFFDGATLFVLHPPLLEAYRDLDADGVADEKEVLVRGIGPDLNFRGADHTINEIRMGIDGWIYIAAGDYGFTNAVGTDGRSLQLHGGGIVRVRPDGTELELFARGTRNICDVAIDPLLDLFTRDNTNDGGGWNVRLSHIIESANYGYPSLFVNFSGEIMPALADYGGGSPTGSLYLDEPGFPEGTGKGLFTCEWGRSMIYRHPLQQDGATYTAGQEAFMAIPRPTDMDVDGQSRLYVSSWKNGGFTYSGDNVGFVLRLEPDGLKAKAFPDLKQSNPARLVRDLQSASQVLRLQAQRELLRRQPGPIAQQLLQRMAADPGSLPGRVAAIFTLKQWLGARANSTLAPLLGDDSIREFVLRALADRRTQLADVPLPPFLSALHDPNPRVRLQALIGLARLDESAAAQAILPLTAESDHAVAHVAVKSLVTLKAIDICLNGIGKPKLTAGALRVLSEIHDAQAVDGLIHALGATSNAELETEILTTLVRLYQREADWNGHWWGTRPDTRGPYYQPVLWAQSEKIARILTQVLQERDPEILPGLLSELARERIELPGTSDLVLELARSPGAARPLAIGLLVGYRDLPAGAIPLFEALALSPDEDQTLRAQAFDAIQRVPADDSLTRSVRILASFAELKQPADEIVRARQAFIRNPRNAGRIAEFVRLAESPEPDTRQLAYGVLISSSRGRRVPRGARVEAEQAVDKAWSQPDSVIPLLRAVGEVRAESFAYQVRTYLKSADLELEHAAEYAARMLQLETAESHPGDHTISNLAFDTVAAEVTGIKGDRRTGAQLFIRQGCVACHTTTSGHAPKGPFLGDIATRYSRAELTESILKPSAKIAQGFSSAWFEMNDGTTHEGFVTRESGDEIELRNVAGIAITLPKKDISRRGTRETSIMPEGLVANLSVEEFASLLAFLESPDSK